MRTVSGGPGAASAIVIINKMLYGVKTVCAAEAVGLGTKLGLDVKLLYEIIVDAA